MKLKFKSLVSISVTLALLTSLSACGSGNSASKNADSSSATTKTQKEPVTLRYMIQTSSLSTGLQASIDYVNSKASELGAKLEVEKAPDGDQGEQFIQARYASGEVPDLLYFHPASYANSRLNVEANFADISDLDFSKVYENSYLKDPGFLLNGKLYCAPIVTVSPMAMFYNKKVLKNASVEVPKNWNEFLKACDTIKSKDITPVFYSAKDTWTLQIMPLTGWYSDYKPEEALQFSKDMETNKKHWVEMNGFIDSIAKTKELVDKGYVQKTFLSDTYQQAQQALLDGKCAFYPMGAWVISELMKLSEEKTNNDIGVFLNPLMDNAYLPTSAAPGTYVSKNGKNVDLAKKAVSTLVSLESHNKFFKAQPDVPASKNITVDLKGPNKDIYDIVKNARTSPQWTDFCKYQKGPLDTYVAEVLVGQKTPKQVAEALDNDFAKAAKAQKDPNWK